MQNMYMLITITRREDSRSLVSLFSRLELPVLYSSLARGTARSNTLNLLGIEATEKTVHQTVVTHNKLLELKKALENEFRIDLPDRGIAVAIPLSSITTHDTLNYFADGHSEDEMKKDKQTVCENELIVAICNRGHTEEIMAPARSAGAFGGTVIHAKGTAKGMEENFFGLSIVDEKEIIYIVTKRETRNAIMQAITDAAGAGTEAHALVFSLPVAQTVGMRLETE